MRQVKPGKKLVYAMAAVVASTVTGPTALPAQTAASQPIDLARKIFDAEQSGDWEAIVKHAHPEALAEFRKQQLEMVHDLIEEGIEAPSRSNRGSQLSFATKYLREVMLVASESELTALPPDSLLGRYLQYTYRAWKSRAPDSTGYERKYIGQLIEGDSLAYVLTQIRQDGHPVGEVDVLTFKRTRSGGWRSFLNGGVVSNSSGQAFSFIGDD